MSGGIFGWGYPPGCSGTPADDVDDTVCVECGAPLPDEGDDEWLDNGFCSKECLELFERREYARQHCNLPEPPQLTCIRPMYNLLCGELDPDPGLWDKRVYKDTSCGAWLNVDCCNQISVGSIVEGADECAEIQHLQWPFTKEEFWEALEAVEHDCERIWNESHGCDTCAELFGIDTDVMFGGWAVHTECPECSGRGVPR
jgi:hypothetical protein